MTAMVFVSYILIYDSDFLTKPFSRAFSNICINTSFQMNQMEEGSDSSVIKSPQALHIHWQEVIL